MKRLHNKLVLIACVLFLIPLMYACEKDYLERGALGSVSETTLSTKAGVDGLLIGAYSLLDGVGSGGAVWAVAVSNWIYGGVASDDAHKGSEYGDAPLIELIENYKTEAVNAYVNDKWHALYSGVQRTNDVLRLLSMVKDGSISVVEAQQIEAEAVFLRAVYHFEAAKMWRNVPYIDEKVSFANGNYKVSNTTSIWARIEADFQFAAANLTVTKPQVGRANSWAAKAFLAKVYMFQHKFIEAKPLLADIIANGVTSSGEKYALVNFSDNFNSSKKNGPESVFAVQMSVKDAANGQNGNGGDVLNFPGGGPSNCCGFYQPSFSLVNSYKTDELTGLPLIYTFNDSDIKNDEGIASSEPFTPYSGTLDPRLDYTVGRRGIPYLDWGLHPGMGWIRQQHSAGPYSPIKNIYYKAEQATTSDTFGGWAANQATSNNYNMIRFADVLLWAAEVEVEVGSLSEAQMYVNLVRARAANADGWVKTYIDSNNPMGGVTNTPAANYKIGLYTNEFAQSQDFAREAVRFERKLELAMEGHRFFDLQRYDNGTGYMADVLNAYIQHETSIPGYTYSYMIGAKFIKGKNEVYPIPQAQIDLSVEGNSSVLEQNQGY